MCWFLQVWVIVVTKIISENLRSFQFYRFVSYESLFLFFILCEIYVARSRILAPEHIQTERMKYALLLIYLLNHSL